MDKKAHAELIIVVFNQYRNSISQAEWDINFWTHFLKHAIEEKMEKEPHNRRFFEAGFSVYNINPDNASSWLWVDRDQTFTIERNDLEQHRKEFFRVILNHSLVKVYNALEMLLFQCVLLAYFPDADRKKGRNATKTGDDLIRKFFRETPAIGKLETRNNRHLIIFLRYHDKLFESFIQQPVRINFTSDWEAFFEMMSILRNVITHHGMLLTRDALNEIRANSKDIFDLYFEYPKDEDGYYILSPKEENSFLALLTFINDLSVNAAKFIFQEKDLSFLGLVKC